MFDYFKGKMTKLINTWFIVLVVLLMNNAVNAGNYVPRIKQLSIKDGLSNSHITTIFQDSKGFIWIGTRNGLNRYDGYEMREYKHSQSDSLSITGNFIRSIAETPDGNIWIGTKDHGIAIWLRESDNFITLPDNLKLSEKEILGMSYLEGHVWALTRNFLVRINADLTAIKEFNHYNNVFKECRYYSYPIVKNRSDLWIGTKDGLLIFDLKKEQFHRFMSYGIYFNDDVSSLFFKEDGMLVIGSSGGLKMLNVKTGDMSIVWAEDRDAAFESINCISGKAGDQIWLGTSRGVEKAEYPFKTHSVYGKGKRWQKKIENYEITCLIFDKSGIMWAGTKNHGLLKINFSQPKFKSISFETDDLSYFKSYNFTSVIKDRDGVLWLGTERDGLYSVSDDFKTVKHYDINQNITYGSADKVNCILEAGYEILWIGTPSGIYVLDKNSGSIKEFDYAGSKEFANLLKNNIINDMLKDRLGDIWIATSFGLYKYNGEKIVSYFMSSGGDGDGSGLCSDVVNVLFQDKHGWLWVGTKEGINYIKRSGGKFSRICNTEGEEPVISDNDIISFGEDIYSDIIWIGTRSGLSFYDKTKFSPGIYRKNNKLYQSMICNVLLDEYNRIWIGTNQGVLSISQDSKMYSFTEEDGLPGYVFNVNSSFKDKNYLYFGGVNGLAYLNTDSLKENVVIPNVVVTGIDILHKGKEIHRYCGGVKEIEFKYKRNTIVKVDFAALEFTRPESNWFRVKLENYDEEWRDATQEHSVVFSNLYPGDYTLKVMGANSDFVWNNEPTKVVIHITPPLWMTGFAYIFYILLGAFIIQLIINFSVRKYRIENKRLKEETEHKHMIEEQKEELTKFNRSLTDSISYAKRIQEAIIPSEAVFRTIVSEAFVYYAPKDIVSGDFYWIYEKGNKIFIAVVDCTGHGVPGAFMSIVGHGMLRNIVEIQEVENPAEVLNRMNDEVIKVFKKNNQNNGDANSLEEVNDGMDMVLCVIDRENATLEYAGAYNPIYLIRDNEILTFKGDRFPIGHRIGQKFRIEIINLLKGDALYLFSDGYADQFGGPDNKKFKYRRFRHLLLNIHKLPMSDQKAILHQKMEEWRRYFEVKQEQVDDMLIIGIKPIV